MRQGNITKRGKSSYRVKIELDRDPVTGARRHHLETVRGLPGEPLSETRARAKARLVELLDRMNKGQHVARSTVTVRGYMESWLAAPVGLNPKTIERYRQLAERQIYPHLGEIELQRLDEDRLQDWHGTLLASGGKGGRPLKPMTVRHAHRVLHTALERAVRGKKLLRNVASSIAPPKVPRTEIAALRADQIGEILEGVADHRLYVPAVLALGAGLRRGEVLALRWCDLDLDAGFVRVGRSLGEAGGQLYVKEPKSAAGWRAVSLAPVVVNALRAHRKTVLEQRLVLRLGKLPEEALVFSTLEGGPISPDKLSRDWANLVRCRHLPKVSFHALRHSNVSMLIDGGLDVYQVSRRIGHSSAALTLKTYTHLFRHKEEEATAAIEAALTAGTGSSPGTNPVPTRGST